MKFYDTSKPLHLETDASGIGLGAGLLQVRDGLNCRSDDILNDTALHPIAFVSRGLSSVEEKYSKLSKRCLAYYMVQRSSTMAALPRK